MIEVFASVIFENPSFGRFFVAELWRPGRAWSEAMRGLIPVDAAAASHSPLLMKYPDSMTC